MAEKDKQQFTDSRFVGIPNITGVIKEGIGKYRQAFANAEATRARGGSRPPITNAPVKPLLGGDANQRNQAAAGTQGTTTGDMSGTGANSLGNVRGEDILKGITPNLFKAPDNLSQQTNQSKNITSNIEKAVAPTPAATVTPTATTAPTPTISPKPPEPITAKLGETTLTQQPTGTLNITSGPTGQGTISFADKRTLNESQLGSLAKQMEFNRSPEGQASFARNAALTAQREAYATQRDLERQRAAELNAAKRAYFGAGTFAGRSQAGRRLAALEEAQLTREKLGVETEQSAATNLAKQQALEFDARKYAGEAAFKGTQEQGRTTENLYKTIAEERKAGTLDVPSALSYFKGFGVPITYSALGSVLDQNQLASLAKSPDKQSFAQSLVDFGITDPEDIISIGNSFYQQQG